jgi:hypothetical protein
MKRTQIQLPDTLYQQALIVAEHREISMAELVRRGLEYMIAVTPNAAGDSKTWELPRPRALGGQDVFEREAWRAELYLERLTAAEPNAVYPDGDPQ